MLPSLCRVMAAILPVSRYRESRDGARRQIERFTCR
jgi:hypothetical protein